LNRKVNIIIYNMKDATTLNRKIVHPTVAGASEKSDNAIYT